MKYWLLAAVAVGVAAMPAGGHAEAAKKIHRSHMTYQPRGAIQSNPDLYGSSSNAAAAGNNANSMSGSNSAGSNANGRTSGGRS
jgi:hypothetical protein